MALTASGSPSAVTSTLLAEESKANPIMLPTASLGDVVISSVPRDLQFCVVLHS